MSKARAWCPFSLAAWAGVRPFASVHHGEPCSTPLSHHNRLGDTNDEHDDDDEDDGEEKEGGGGLASEIIVVVVVVVVVE
jgi:hypothetical protein